MKNSDAQTTEISMVWPKSGSRISGTMVSGRIRNEERARQWPAAPWPAALGEGPGGENDEGRLDELRRLEAEDPAPRALHLGAVTSAPA